MNYNWRAYPLNPLTNSPSQIWTGNEPPALATLLHDIGVASSDNPTLTRVLDNYWVLSFATPALGSPETGNNQPCVFAMIGQPA